MKGLSNRVISPRLTLFFAERLHSLYSLWMTVQEYDDLLVMADGFGVLSHLVSGHIKPSRMTIPPVEIDTGRSLLGNGNGMRFTALPM